MATRSIHDTIRFKRIINIQTLTTTGSPTQVGSGDIDLEGFDSHMVGIDFGDIDEMGTSPVGTASIDVRVEDAPDDGTGAAGSYSVVEAADIDGLTPDAAGTVASPTTDTAEVTFGYIGPNRFLRVTLIGTALANGGPVGAWMISGHAHLSPVTQG